MLTFILFGLLWLSFGISVFYYLPPLRERDWFLTHTSISKNFNNRTLWRCYLTNRCLSYIHCVTCFLGCYYLSGNPNPLLSKYLISYSLGYYCLDIIYNWFMEYNLIFIIHHLATIFIWLAALNNLSDLVIPIYGFLLAETSSLLLIPWEVSGKMNWVSIRSFLCTPTMILYVTVRTFLLPYYILSKLFYIYQLPITFSYRILIIHSMLLIALGSICWTPVVINKCYIKNPGKTKKLLQSFYLKINKT